MLKGYFVVQDIKMKNDWIALMQICQSFSNSNNDAHLLMSTVTCFESHLLRDEFVYSYTNMCLVL
jgi:hypothetical protein